MQLTNLQKFLIGVVALVALITLHIILTKNTDVPAQVIGTEATSTSQKIPGTDFVIQGNGDYTITAVPSETIAIPDLNRRVIFGSTIALSDEAKKILIDKIVSLQASLKKDPKNVTNWIQLGVDQKIAGDFEGAVISWKYAGDVSNDSISYGNLGNLYAYYLKDRSTAEAYYKKAISRAPTQAYLYIQLSGVYKDVFSDISKAKSIIDEGLGKIPNDKSLLEAKANLNK